MFETNSYHRLLRSSGHLRTSHLGFTLVELMVVIAIIGTLISILLPSLSAIRTQTRVATTKVTLSVLETGIQLFEVDSRIGGALPPSCAPATSLPGFENGQIVNPHTGGNEVPIDGASLLLWALAGADLLGTPGFQDLNGNVTWADDVGSLYALGAASRPRSGPFVDISKMKLPRLTSAGAEIPSAVGKNLKSRCLPSPCFLDSFGQPVLYYRANRNKPFMVGNAVGTANAGIYNLADNVNITTGDGTCSLGGICNNGLDFGQGAITSDGKHHYIADPGVCLDNLNPIQVFPVLQNPANRSFSRTIWNPNVTAVPRPYNDKSFILLSAGPDGIYGSPDDAANFEVNK